MPCYPTIQVETLSNNLGYSKLICLAFSISIKRKIERPDLRVLREVMLKGEGGTTSSRRLNTGEGLQVLEGSKGGGNGVGEVKVAEAGEEGECVGEGAGEEVLGEVEMEERGAGGYLEREGFVDGVVEEDDGGVVGEAA